MNKDVIYIEPEDDITDILTNIKGAKNKIIALVPPKKAGVLRSAVNFKLIAKAANQAKKTVVLISSDESLVKLAAKVKMPVAKTLQSKPKLPEDLDAEEFGDEKDDVAAEDDVIEGDDEAEEDVAEEAKDDEAKKADDKEKKTPKKAAAVASKKKALDMEIDDADYDDESDKKTSGKKKDSKNVPNFNKVRKPLIIGVIAFLLLFGFGFWAFAIAPEAKIVVKIRTSPLNISENVKFVTDESKADPEKGIFYISQQSIKKTIESDFTATGEVDKGKKATGSIIVKARSPVYVDLDMTKTIEIPAGTSFNYNSQSYISSTAAKIEINEDNFKGDLGNCNRVKIDDERLLRCDLSADATATINVVAAENGDKYNITEATSGWSTDASGIIVASSSAMTGGSSKKVKVVSQKDVETAEAGLENEGESEAREELTRNFSNSYLLIENSFTTTSGKLTSSPAINEEVKDGMKPKVIKEVKYSIYAVERDALNKFIKAKANVGDDTQTLYSTGISDAEDENDKGRIESFKNDKDGITGILKTVAKTGPAVTEQMLADKALGKKIGEVQSLVKSIKGVSEVKVHTSYFWVTSVPGDPNKVSYDISVE